MAPFDRHPVRNSLILIAGAFIVTVIIGTAVGAKTAPPRRPPASPSSIAQASPLFSSPPVPSPAATRTVHSRRSDTPAATRTSHSAPSAIRATSAAAVPSPVQVASTPPPPPPPPPPSTPPPPPATTVSCTPLTDAGNCYEPGEYCRDSDHGVTGVAGDGETITCEDNDGWRWEPA